MTRPKHARTSATTGRKLAAGALSVPMALTMAGTAAATEPVTAETTVVASTTDELLAHDALAATPAASKAELPAQAGGEAGVAHSDSDDAEPEARVQKTETVDADASKDDEVVVAEEQTTPRRQAPSTPGRQQPAADEDAPGNGTTCDQLGYTKLDSSSGEEDLSFGTLDWSGDTLTYTIDTGYTVELCVKGGSESPLVELGAKTSGGSYTHPQAISHIGYRIVDTPDDEENTGDGGTGVIVEEEKEEEEDNGTVVIVPDEDEETPAGPTPQNPANPGSPIVGGEVDAGTGTPPSSGGGTPVVETPVVSTPVTPALPVSGQPAPSAGSGVGSTGVVGTGASAPQAFTPTRTAGAGSSTASPTTLPFTGSTTSLLLALGTGLVVVGGGLALSGRRESAGASA